MISYKNLCKKRKLNEEEKYKELKEISESYGTVYKEKNVDVQANMGFSDFILGQPDFEIVNIIRQGYEYYQRVGKKISMKKVYIRYWIEWFNLPSTPGAQPIPFFAKIALVYDRQARNQPADIDYFPRWEEIYGGKRENSVSVANTALMYPEPTNSERFLILWEKNYCFLDTNWYSWEGDGVGTIISNPNTNFTGVLQEQKMFENVEIELNDLETNFEEKADPFPPQPVTGALYFLCHSFEESGPFETFIVHTLLRLVYTDK